MKFQTIEELAQNVAEKALDEFGYKGKTLRQWVEIILATDINVATKDGTNLASLGTDCISRQAAIDAVMECYDNDELFEVYEWKLNELPTIHPKRGKWIPVTNGRSGHECDQCHEYAPSYQTGEEHLSDFCPNCGADMRGEQYG